MRKLSLLVLLGAVAVFLMGCPKPPPPPPEEPVVAEPEPEPEPPEPEPKPEPEPEPVLITEADFVIVYFDFDKYNLVDSAKAALDNNARVLKENPNVVIMIEGHCDERGTIEYNLSLGEKRASSAMQYLVDLGINAARLKTISYGKEKPAMPGHNEAAWAKNRRAEFKVMSQ
ncbi:MAG: peptidoglycan-associated lipoprotein Pal [Candidatus Zixiibacteriota bacterium]|nr:MAG: peptidoglycan-associated lipoprotein Pal [candidate division Zixibacteria bacterium]